ncbi:uncharacterized protein MONBRDRAFT_37550, partial [Monosiga brevicollis MX1]
THTLSLSVSLCVFGARRWISSVAASSSSVSLSLLVCPPALLLVLFWIWTLIRGGQTPSTTIALHRPLRFEHLSSWQAWQNCSGSRPPRASQQRKPSWARASLGPTLGSACNAPTGPSLKSAFKPAPFLQSPKTRKT